MAVFRHISAEYRESAVNGPDNVGVMAMNLLHRLRCSSANWERTVADQLLPWALDQVELGPRTLEIGPGYGATLRALLDRTTSLTAVEVDRSMADRLNRLYGDRARIVHGDGTKTGLPDGQFTSVVCFTMLHHIPSPQLQDQLFGEAFRLLQPGCAFAGSDGVPSLSFRLKHIADTYNPIPPEDLPGRLRKAGFTDIHIDANGSLQRWRATKPA
jgi:SAM-dependent methyltransferase